MKSIAFLLLSSLTVISVSGGGFQDIRGCPSGYFFAGDDSPDTSEDVLKSYWEVGRTPTYSCYKEIHMVNGINDGLEQCYTSVIGSDNMEGRVVIFEDADEVERVFEYILRPSFFIESSTILTSAMNFTNVNGESKWIYLGTNHTKIEIKNIAKNITGNGQCLTVKATKNVEEGTIMYDWEAVDCVGPQTDVLCEIRIETVTYAWVPNWLSITLIILTIVLLVTCCMAAMSYKHYKPRAYRGSDQSPQGMAYPTDDAPPKYSDVTGTIPNQEQGKIDKYKNKGKELLAKIYVVKEN